MTSLAELRFFTTPEHDCSYLDGKQTVAIFVDPVSEVDTRLYSKLSMLGFRRSGAHIYRPHCPDCAACVPLRILTQHFQPTRKHRRICNRNRELNRVCRQPRVTDEYFLLYEKYINHRHAGGDMYPAEVDQFQSFLVEGRPEAVFYEIRDKDKLLAVAVADGLDDGLSAIYTFFDPEYEKQSLGTLAILDLIEESRKQGKPYLYLGYWIKDCRKMSYKTEFMPSQMFLNDQWLATEEPLIS